METSSINIFALLVSIISIIVGIVVSIASYFLKETHKDNKKTADALAQIPIELSLLRSSLTLVEEKNKAAYRLLDERLNGFSRRLDNLEADAANRNYNLTPTNTKK